VLVAAAKILAVKMDIFIDQACLPCQPAYLVLFCSATSALIEVDFFKLILYNLLFLDVKAAKAGAFVAILFIDIFQTKFAIENKPFASCSKLDRLTLRAVLLSTGLWHSLTY
jgi:hypothetical protein